ncbi:MAG: hypothetical protein PHV88_03490 [Eubacteriales bacterium]|nr:hypothetical protein [Eubacteriales bacterium]
MFVSYIRFGFPVRAINYTYFYSPETISSISGRAYADSDCPSNWLNMSLFGATGNGVSQIISNWNLGDFTYLVSPSPVGSYQRGISNGDYGSTSVQMTSDAVGAELHTWSIPGGSGYNYNLLNGQVKYKWDYTDNKRPWAHSNSVFKFSFNLKVNNSYMIGGSCGYVYASILIEDPNGKYFSIQPQIYDTRYVPNSEYVGWDAGMNAGYANSYYRYDNNGVARYCTKNPASYSSTNSTWTDWHWYGFSIDRTQLLNAINDVNNTYGAGLSTDPSEWRLLLITIQDEIYWPTGNGHLSFAAKDLWAYEEY